MSAVRDAFRQYEKRIFQLEDVLRKLEWSGEDGICPLCGDYSSVPFTHYPSCELDILLKESRNETMET